MEYITAKQAATRLGITTGRIRQLILGGRLKAHKAGRDWLIRPVDLVTMGKSKRGRPKKENKRGK